VNAKQITIEEMKIKLAEVNKQIQDSELMKVQQERYLKLFAALPVTQKKLALADNEVALTEKTRLENEISRLNQQVGALNAQIELRTPQPVIANTTPVRTNTTPVIANTTPVQTQPDNPPQPGAERGNAVPVIVNPTGNTGSEYIFFKFHKTFYSLRLVALRYSDKTFTLEKGEWTLATTPISAKNFRNSDTHKVVEIVAETPTSIECKTFGEVGVDSNEQPRAADTIYKIHRPLLHITSQVTLTPGVFIVLLQNFIPNITATFDVETFHSGS
jgi:hypothetical protein